MKMRSILAIAALGCATVALAGCQQEMMPDSKIAYSTAGVLGISPDALTIEGRRGDATNTYYRAHDHTTGARYACVVNGGGLLALGLSAPPSCNRM